MTFSKYIILLNIGLVYFSQALLANEPSLSNQTAAEYNKIGENYLKGQGTSINYRKAAEYFTKAADQGDANAQCHLGMLYFYGSGVTIDYTKSAEYLTKAANQGNSNAQLQMGMLYSDGKGVPQDYTKAVEYFTKAANQGNIDAKQLSTYLRRHGRLRIYNDNPTLLKETLAAFEQENKDWEKLIEDASSATYSYNEGGSWRGIVANTRALELMKYRIHNQWRNWLIFTDKVSEYDPPEPMFKKNY